MSILSQIIAYSPNKIDTETKAKALAIGPRAMVGEITDEQTQFGKPIYQTPAGEKVSEKSTTLFFNGDWMNVPSIHGGKSFNEDELRLMIKQGNLQPTSVHKSKADAEAAAEARSNSMVQGPRNMAEGGRMGFNKGLKVPKLPNLKIFPSFTYDSKKIKAKQKVIDKFKNDLKKYLLQEIKEFKKTSLPKEKYQIIENDILREMGYDPVDTPGKKRISPPSSLRKYIKEAINELPKNKKWELNTTGKGVFASGGEKKGTPIPENIKNKIKDFFRKNYKNLNISQMAERLTNKIGGHPLHSAVKTNLARYKNFLIEKNVIKETDISKGMGGAEGVNKLPPKAYADYKKEYLDLAKKAGITKDSQFFATRGKLKGKFGYWKFDDYMKNTMLNMDKIRNALSPNFPTLLLPSFEHTMGVKPGYITGDTSALKKVELQTKKYNFGAIDGMGARSADFRRVQSNLKSATKELKAGNIDAANKSLAKVNQIYDNVAEKFNLNRKGLPNYNVDGKNVLEVNIKEVSKAEKPRVSAFNFFDKVANQASEKEMKVIKKSDPKVFGVLKEFQGKKDVKKINNLLSKFEAFGCGKAAGGRILFSEGTPDGKPTKCAQKGVARFINDLKKGNYSKATVNILKGGGNVLKNIVNPKELLKIRNYFGPTALGFMGLFETGVITDDVIRQGTPLNESLANNWLTRYFLPYTKDYAKAKNLLESGTVPSNMRKYVEDVVTFNEGLKEVERIENMASSRIADVGGYGMIDGSSMYSQEQEDKDVNNLIKKMSTISEDVITPGTGKALEMKALQDEMEATRMAKKEFSPIFGFDKLKDVRTPGSTSFDYIPDETPKDFRPITYQDAEYKDTKLPLGIEQAYMNKFKLKPRDSLSNYFFKGSEKNVLEELTDDYNKFKRQEEASKYPGYFGANEKFMEGGIASLNVNKK